MITYTILLSLVEAYTQQGFKVSFDSEKNTITFKSITSAEMMAFSTTLKGLGFNNEIVLLDALSYRIRFI